MKIGFIKRDTTLIPRYSALVTVRLDDQDVRVWSEGRPLRVKFLLIELTRPSGHGEWDVKQVKVTGWSAKGRIPRGRTEPTPEQKRRLIEDTTQWRQASYETDDFTMTPEVERIIEKAVSDVEADCVAANNP